MTAFYRFPHTPHVAWLGEGTPRDDKVLVPHEANSLLAGEVVVEEKVDGANVGLSVSPEGEVRLQNRGSYLHPESSHAQFKPLFRWLAPRAESFAATLTPNLILFGEWLYAVHSVRYTRLPDWFLAFDVYDRKAEKFWSVSRRDRLVKKLQLALVPRVAEGHFTVTGLQRLLGVSKLSDRPMEGIVIRREEGDWVAARAKLVRPEFVQAIGEHWSRRKIQTNIVVPRAA